VGKYFADCTEACALYFGLEASCPECDEYCFAGHAEASALYFGLEAACPECVQYGFS
jgi:uncharacterized protein (DUF983 family)